MIELRNIYKSYGTQQVLEDVSITFETGELSMVLGPSGCGKSTSLKMINRIVDADQGQILIDGHNILEMEPHLLRRSVGYAIQGVGLFPHMTVRENIAVVPKLLQWDRKKINDRVDDLMDLMGIPDSYSSKKPSMLSGGEAQRIGVARALGADPDILLMDEPFGALDPITRRRLQQEFVALQKKLNKTVVFVTHDIGEALRMADRLILIQKGKVVAADRPEAMVHLENESIRSFFGDQFTFELLGKYTVRHYLSMLTDLKDRYNDDVQPTICLSSDISMRNVLAFMLEKSVMEVGIMQDGKIYKVSFADILELYGGVTNG